MHRKRLERVDAISGVLVSPSCGRKSVCDRAKKVLGTIVCLQSMFPQSTLRPKRWEDGVGHLKRCGQDLVCHSLKFLRSCCLAL